MWWPYIPWLLFLIALGGTFAVYRFKHRKGHAQPGGSAPVERSANTPRKW
jgi:hypothetical protein